MVVAFGTAVGYIGYNFTGSLGIIANSGTGFTIARAVGHTFAKSEIASACTSAVAVPFESCFSIED